MIHQNVVAKVGPDFEPLAAVLAEEVLGGGVVLEAVTGHRVAAQDGDAA